MEVIQNENLKEKISNIFKSNIEFDYTYTSNSINDTITLAKEIAKYLKQGIVISLNGELGAGKTLFMQGIAEFFNIQDQISSPTFTIVNEYITNENSIFHFDVYRLENSDEFLDSIGTEYFSDGICVIEWGNIIQDILPKNTINIDISKDEIDENKRYLKLWRK